MKSEQHQSNHHLSGYHVRLNGQSMKTQCKAHFHLLGVQEHHVQIGTCLSMIALDEEVQQECMGSPLRPPRMAASTLRSSAEPSSSAAASQGSSKAMDCTGLPCCHRVDTGSDLDCLQSHACSMHHIPSPKHMHPLQYGEIQRAQNHTKQLIPMNMLASCELTASTYKSRTWCWTCTCKVWHGA